MSDAPEPFGAIAQTRPIASLHLSLDRTTGVAVLQIIGERRPPTFR